MFYTCKVVVLPIRPIAVLTLWLPSPSSHRKVPIAAKYVVKRFFAFYYPRTTNQVVACCTNTDLWLVKIKRESIPHTGFTSLAAKSVCLGPVKREMSTYYVTKSRTSLYFPQQLSQLETTWFIARQVWFVGGKTRNIAIQVLQQCCITSCTFSLKVNSDVRPRPHLGCDNITSTQGRCCVQRF